MAAVPAPEDATTFAGDFLTDIWLTRIDVFFPVSLERRRIEFVDEHGQSEWWLGRTAGEDLLMLLDDRTQSLPLPPHDRDSKFGGGFDQILHSEGMTIVRTPVRTPNANAHAERWAIH